MAIFQFSLIISIQIAFWLVTFDRYTITILYYCSPTYTVLVLLIVSFCMLKGSERNEESLSNINIGIQTLAYALYTASNLLFFLDLSEKTLYLGNAFDFISLSVLILSLLKIVKLQLKF